MVWCLFEFNGTKRSSLHCKQFLFVAIVIITCRLFFVLYNVRQISEGWEIPHQNICIEWGVMSGIFFFFFSRRYNPWWVLACFTMMSGIACHIKSLQFCLFWDMTKGSILSFTYVSFIGNWGSTVAIERATLVLGIRVQIPARRHAILHFSRFPENPNANPEPAPRTDPRPLLSKSKL